MFIFPNGRVYQCPLCEDHPIHAFEIEGDRLVRREGLTEARFFPLAIPEGCVMNRLLQPDNISYHPDGTPVHRISCCLLKQEVRPQAGCGKFGSAGRCGSAQGQGHVGGEDDERPGPAGQGERRVGDQHRAEQGGQEDAA